MITNGNRIVTSSKDINETFERFYKNLYTSSCSLDAEETETFFADLDVPAVSDEQREQFDAPITEEEIKTSILSMKTEKSPGMDGFPVEYYK